MPSLTAGRSTREELFGNADYPDHQLSNPVNDAVDLGAKLLSYGFNVIVATDCAIKLMEKRLKEFRSLLDTHEVGLFFFAGHGMQIEGSNYLFAVDSDMESETDAKHSSLSLDKVVDVLARSKASTRIIVLDACRNNPWERAWHRTPATRGLASVYAPKGTIIGFATSPGEVASDGVGRNGTYTEALLQHIDAPDCSIEMMFKRVRNTVAAATSGKQTTWEHTSLSGEFYFNLGLGKLLDEYDGTALADDLLRDRSNEDLRSSVATSTRQPVVHPAEPSASSNISSRTHASTSPTSARRCSTGCCSRSSSAPKACDAGTSRRNTSTRCSSCCATPSWWRASISLQKHCWRLAATSMRFQVKDTISP